jgi:hypothetical protein
MGSLFAGSYSPAIAPPLPPARAFDVIILFNGVPATRAAVRLAAEMTKGLAARLRLVCIEIVPYPLPLDSAARGAAFLEGQLHACLDASWLEEGEMTATAELVYCRDPWDGLRLKLAPGSVVVIAKRGWWPRREDRLARHLRRTGHHVVRASLRAPSRLAHLFPKESVHA